MDRLTPELLAGLAGLIVAITALVKAIRGDARKLEDLEPAEADAPTRVPKPVPVDLRRLDPEFRAAADGPSSPSSAPSPGDVAPPATSPEGPPSSANPQAEP